jgi:SAM-dependent methyltransferase
MTSAPFACRACGGLRLTPVLSLGTTPLANSLLTQAQLAAPEPRFPLDLAFCESCSLLQITAAPPPEALFSDYLYFSSFSETMLKHARAIAERTARDRKLGADALVMEIASNDGYLLQYYKALGIPVLGIEPARNIAVVAENQRGIPTLVEFFGAELAQRLRNEGRLADVIHANNVFAHVPDLNGFVSGLATVLRDGGVAIVEFPYAREMIEHCEFDTIYHEHLSYFSLTAVDTLVRKHGLVVADAELLPIHGGSLRIFLAKGSGPARAGAATLLEAEAESGVGTYAYYAEFARRVNALRGKVRDLLRALKTEGKTIAAYGAAAKGSTLLNYFGIGRETLDFVADRSTHKQGRFMPGVHVPIVAPEHLLAAQPDYTLLLTWNFADEIMEQQSEYRRRGGQFIVPVPDCRVV